MKLIYRISDAGYNKIKPDYINNENCLKNASRVFDKADWIVIADNCSQSTLDMISKYQSNVIKVSVGHGAGTFNLALDEALKYEDEEVVYFLENDYLHDPRSQEILLEGFETGADYVSLYDHPDKYIDGANPFVETGGEVTRVMLTKSCHWKLTNSTTMTFASAAKTLKQDESNLRKYTSGSYPRDFEMFIELRDLGRALVTPIPGYATHGETAWLSPLKDWSKV